MDELLDSCIDDNAIVFLELELLSESLGIREVSNEGQTISRMMQRIERDSYRLKGIRRIISDSMMGNPKVANKREYSE